MSTRLLPVVVEQDEDGFFADRPSLQGCHSQGHSFGGALANLKDAVELHIIDRKAPG